mgnify:CR=1 FL=1
MKDKTPSPAGREAQPWHPADDKPRRKGAPLGTHSLTGSGASVGMPPKAEDAERSIPDPAAPEDDIDPLLEPRAGGGNGPLGPR